MKLYFMNFSAIVAKKVKYIVNKSKKYLESSIECKMTTNMEEKYESSYRL